MLCKQLHHEFGILHTFLQGMYARRENMTDVVIEALSGGPRVRMKCNSHVRKIAVYGNLVAVQVHQSFVVYERSAGTAGESVQYAIKSQLAISRECDLLQVLIFVCLTQLLHN